jgi:hypothetical protein
MIDIVTRLNQTRADMLGTDDEDHYWDCHEAVHEIERLREAIRRLAEQDATLSVCDGTVTVTMDATLTDAEREALKVAVEYVGSAYAVEHHAKTIERLLESELRPRTLTLTDAERVAIAWAANESDYWAGEGFNSSDDPRYAEIAATLRGLLERTA